MAISDKLQELLNIKQDIKEAIENKGGDLTGVDFDGYAEKIDEIPSSKEEQTKTVSSPNFASGNVVVTPDTGKVLTQVTVVKDSNLIADSIKSGVTIFGITGTYEGEPNGFTLTLDASNFFEYGGSVSRIELLQYSIDNGSTWVNVPINTITNVSDVLTIKLKAKLKAGYNYDHIIVSTSLAFEGYNTVLTMASYGEETTTNNVTLTADSIIDFEYYDD